MRLARRQDHQAKRKVAVREGVGQAILSKQANSAKLRNNQNGRGRGLFLGVGVTQEG